MLDDVREGNNIAADSAFVAMQVQTIRGDVIFQTAPDDSPARRYQIGVNYLDTGAPETARQYIDLAMARGHSGSDVMFHWLLALLSGKTLLQLTDPDHRRLRERLKQYRPARHDAWADGVTTIRSLLIAQNDDQDHPPDPRFDRLGKVQQDKIFQHLELLLKGPEERNLWNRAVQQATENQLKDARVQRVWKYFQPVPARPRRYYPEPVRADDLTSVVLVVCGLVFAVAVLCLAILVLHGTAGWHAVAVLPALFGGYRLLVDGVHWLAAKDAVRAREKVLFGELPEMTAPPKGGFAEGIDRYFDRYFGTYVPRDTERTSWQQQTAGIRRLIRNEIVEIFRESDVKHPQLAWLVRRRVSVVRTQWETGALWQYRRELGASTETKRNTALGLTAFTIFGLLLVMEAFRAQPLQALLMTVVAVGAVRVGAPRWIGLVSEKDRFKRESREAEAVLAHSMEAYERWTQKLADRPSETEMATWLDCDRKILMQKLLDHYHVAPDDLIAQAFIEAPAPGSSRARVVNGPWRYTRYRLLVFLITHEGVRQVSTELEFAEAVFSKEKRTNYSFGTVSSVYVAEGDSGHEMFELRLLDGQKFDIPVDGAGVGDEVDPEDTPGVVSKVTFDAAGLNNTLHVLEGIAAEGKEWVNLEKSRGKERMAELLAVMGEGGEN
ncbi:hypothetical protein Kisp02_59020 [Kineosporia sp. NBRC 101731]|nr:hypothetical protein Kisp02_59020 [Kineosporia sp. NBRC 101731]